MHNRFGMDEVELFVEQVPIDLQMNSPIGNFIPLLLGENDGTSNVQNPFTFEHISEEDEEDEEGRQCDDDSVGAKDVHNDDNQDRESSSPFLAIHEAIEREQMRYVVVDGQGCNLSNNPNTEDLDDPIELSSMQYHLAPSPQFENVENIGHVVSKQANPRCVVISKTFPGNMQNEEVFQRVFWAFHPSIEGFKHCHPVLTIEGKHLYGKYKAIVRIAMGCDGNNQLFPLAFALTEVTQRKGLCVISDRHPGIMAAFANVYLGWSEPNAYHRICMCHLASNFMTRFKDKCLKQLLCRAALETKVEKFNMHMETIGRINQDTLSWLEAIPFEKWALSHDGVNSYFAVKREDGASRLASSEEYTPYVDAKINANVVKADSMKRVSGGRPKSTRLHNEMDVREDEYFDESGCLYFGEYPIYRGYSAEIFKIWM
uniref:MULE transposase domain-containing protein n=1 Tax=Vitis vinifera TaxID=29760 RepID=A5BKE9_VITVI|nr:hypothetical protein VITISV_019183 [Vitis vinifera]